MQANWPTGGKPSVRSALFAVLGVSFGCIAYSIWESLILAIVAGVAACLFLPLWNAKAKEVKFKRHLLNVGEPIEFKENKELENKSVVGAIPFKNLITVCFLYVHEDGLIIGRGPVHRFLAWANIFSFKQFQFAGNTVMELSVGSFEEKNRIVVPWSEDLDAYLPKDIDIKRL